MTVDFSIHSLHSGTQDPTRSASGTEAVSGAFMGHAVTVVSDPMSLLADAAEELTFSIDTTDEFELSEREEEDKSLKALEARVQLYKEMMHQAGKSKELNHLTEQLRSARTKDDTLRQVRERFPDSSDAYAALEHALEELEKSGASSESIQVVKNAREDLFAEAGSAIRAGIQAALSAQTYGDLDSGDALRGLYRRVVCDFPNVNTLFDHILATYGDDKFDQAVSFLTRTLGADMAADIPSMEKTHLESVNANLGQVRLLQSANAQCCRVMDRWKSVHGVDGCPLNASTLLGKILALRGENFLGADNFERIATEAKPPDIGREVLFLQEVMAMIRSLPSLLFDGHSGHMKMLDAVQSAVDNAIEREDAFFAAQEE